MKQVAFYSHNVHGKPRFGIQKVTQLLEEGLVKECEKNNIAADFFYRSEDDSFMKKILWDQLYPLFHTGYEKQVFLSFKASLLSQKKTFVLFNDIAFLTHKEWFPKSLNMKYTDFLVRGLAKKANVEILTVSKFSQSEICSYLGVPIERVHVFTQPISDVFIGFNHNEARSKDVLNSLNINQPYIYFAGTLSPRKNIVRSLEAFAKIKKEITGELDFVISGKFGWDYNEVIQTIKNNNLDDSVKFVGYVDEDVLPILYANAVLTSYASLYEGYGYPVLESLMCGTPVVTSKGTSTEEIKGIGVELVNPYKEDEIYQAYKKILGSNKSKEGVRPLIPIPTAETAVQEILSFIQQVK